MTYLIATALAVLILYGFDRAFKLAARGRAILTVLVLVWGLIDGVLSARANPQGPAVAFTLSLLDSLVVIVLWRWLVSFRRANS
jgi:hypothetical protein